MFTQRVVVRCLKEKKILKLVSSKAAQIISHILNKEENYVEERETGITDMSQHS